MSALWRSAAAARRSDRCSAGRPCWARVAFTRQRTASRKIASEAALAAVAV
jgi:hypothetical protein